MYLILTWALIILNFKPTQMKSSSPWFTHYDSSFTPVTSTLVNSDWQLCFYPASWNIGSSQDKVL